MNDRNHRLRIGLAAVAAIGAGCGLPEAGPIDDTAPPTKVNIRGDDLLETALDLPEGFAAAPYGPLNKWHHMNILRPHQAGELRWFLAVPTNDGFDAREVIRRAYGYWQPFVPFRFVEAASESQANTVIRFVNGPTYEENGVNKSWWDATGVILGVAYRPLETVRGLGYDRRGDIQINDLANWKATTEVGVTVNGKPGGGTGYVLGTLQDTLVHEIGHSLGLAHDESSTRNVMYPSGNETGTGALWDADVKAIVQLYQMPYDAVFGLERSTKIATNVFWLILDRAPTTSEMTTTRDRLLYNSLPSRRGQYDWKRLLIDVTASLEAWNYAGANPHDYVAWMYYWMLNRWPSEAEINGWTAHFPGTLTRTQLAQGFADSAEFCETRLWGLIRGRTGGYDIGLFNALIGPLKSKAINLEEAEVAIVNSPAFFATANPLTNQVVLTRVFQTVLGRQPTTAELEAYLNWID